MLNLRRMLVTVTATGLLLTPLASGSTSAFTGYWWGHTRSLRISADGQAVESIFSGCCLRVINLHLRVLKPTGTAQNATVETKVAAVWVPHPIGFTRRNPPPKVGETGMLRLRHGVITDTLTGATYCAPKVDKCGA